MRLAVVLIEGEGEKELPLHHANACCCSLGVEVRHMWGMTEISPLGSLGVPTSTQIGDGLSKEELLDIKVGSTAQYTVQQYLTVQYIAVQYSSVQYSVFQVKQG